MERRPATDPDLDESLTIRASEASDHLLVALAGELDFANRTTVFDICTGDPLRDVVVDLSDLTFLDCAGYQGLLDARLVLVARGGSLEVINLDGEPRYLLDLIGERELVPW